MNRIARLTAATVVVVLVCVFGAQAVEMDTVTVGNPGNAGEWSGASYGGWGPDRICGAVENVYEIGKFEVTAGQYTEFLNAVAATDTYELYNPDMLSRDVGCKIRRIGSPGSYVYLVDPNEDGVEDADWIDRPVNFVSWGDIARFANWMHNGQLTGAQNLSTTEDGSYFLNGATMDEQLLAVVREPDATWVIPSEDEWYKAAYHKNDGATGDYWDYPTGTNTVPNNGNPEGDTGNSANYDDGIDRTIGPPYHRTVVGSFGLSAGPYGTFDQGGNVWEWNEGLLNGSSRGNRGGSFSSYIIGLYAAGRFNFEPTFEYYGLGFRVAHVSEPEPIPAVSEWGLIVMGLLMLTAGTVVLPPRGCARQQGMFD